MAKRHKEWAPLTVLICSDCLHADHVRIHMVRYPAMTSGKEVCQCPCRHAQGQSALKRSA